MMNMNPNTDELMAIDAEISELQRENLRVESQMLRLKSDISAIETQLNHNDRVCKPRLVDDTQKCHNQV